MHKQQVRIGLQRESISMQIMGIELAYILIAILVLIVLAIIIRGVFCTSEELDPEAEAFTEAVMGANPEENWTWYHHDDSEYSAEEMIDLAGRAAELASMRADRALKRRRRKK